MQIDVSHLSKRYQIPQKDPGVRGSITSFLHRTYSSVVAVDNISFEIAEGELVGFIGPNGAGKTTTLKMLSGLLYPTSGTVEVLGFTPFSRKAAFLKQISLVMGQKNQLWWDLPAVDTFLLNKEIYEISDEKYRRSLTELVELLAVGSVMQTPVRKLSLGQRMKMELIAALIHSPKVLFLDEPTIGLDVVMQQNMREFIKAYNERYKATIILTSHYMDDVKQLCRRVIVIDRGAIMYDGLLSDIVKKLATHKQISVIFNDKVDSTQLHKIASLTSFEYPQASFNVRREESNQLAAYLLGHFPVEDITIEEIAIEDIIREVFTGKELG